MCSGSAQGSDHTSAGKQEKVNHFPKSPQLLTILFWDIPQGQSRYPARKDHFVLFIKQSCCQILPICHYLLPLPQWSLKKRWRLYPTRSLMMPLLRCVGVVLGSLQIFFLSSTWLYLQLGSVVLVSCWEQPWQGSASFSWVIWWFAKKQPVAIAARNLSKARVFPFKTTFAAIYQSSDYLGIYLAYPSLK